MENFDAIASKNNLSCAKKYIQKEQFIEMLQNLDFLAIRSADLELITCFVIDVEKDFVDPKTIKLELY